MKIVLPEGGIAAVQVLLIIMIIFGFSIIIKTILLEKHLGVGSGDMR